jgi:hypothetical protein
VGQDPGVDARKDAAGALCCGLDSRYVAVNGRKSRNRGFFAVLSISHVAVVALSAYRGGAVGAHLSVGKPFWFPVVTGLVFWWSLWLRDPRLRALLPVRRTED